MKAFATSRVLLLCLCALALFALPVAMVVTSAFRTAPGSAGLLGGWTTAAITTVLGDPATHRALRNSVLLALCSVSLGTVLAITFAWLSARTASPLRRILTPVMVVLFAVPPLSYALSWAMLGQRPAGVPTQLGQVLTGSDAAPINPVSWPGLVLVLALKIASVSYLLIVGAFAAMDASLGEAARTAGASRLRALLTIELPALAPVLFRSVLIGVVVAVGTLDLPLILGRPAGIPVLSTEVYDRASTPSGIPGSATIGLLLMAMVVVLLIIQRLVPRSAGRPAALWTGSGRSHGRSHRRERVRLGAWGWLSGSAIALFSVISLGLPMGQLVIASFQPDRGNSSRLTLANYTTVLADPRILSAFRSTIVVGVGAGLLATVLAVTFGVLAQRSTSRLRRLPAASTGLLLAVPGVTLGLGILAAVLAIPPLRALHGTQVPIVIGLMVAVTPVAGRAAVAQVGRELAESARTSGASATRALVGILLRVILPSFAAGWFIAAVVAAGNFDVPALLSAPGSPTLPVMAFELVQSGSVGPASALFCLLLGLIAVVLAIGGLLRARPGPRPALPLPPPSTRRSRPSVSEPSEVARV